MTIDWRGSDHSSSLYLPSISLLYTTSPFCKSISGLCSMVLGNQDNVLFPVSSLNLYQYVSPIFVITMNVTGISYNGHSECHHLFGFALRLTLSHQPAARGSQNTERGNVWLRLRGEDTSTKRQMFSKSS